MLRANVGVSKKMSKDYNSRGFTLNLEGEIHATLDDPEAVIERIKELYDLAEEALDQQVDRHQSDSAIAQRDKDCPKPGRNGYHDEISANDHGPDSDDRRDGKTANGEPASSKQVQFLRTLAGRRKLTGDGLADFIEAVLGRRRPAEGLTRKEAGAVIDALNAERVGDDRPRR